MQVSVESINNLVKQINVVLPEQQIAEELGKYLQELQQKAQVQGYRRGKVPLQVIEMLYKKSAFHQVAMDLVQTSLQSALEQEKIIPASTPKIEKLQIEEGKPVEYTVSVEIFPEIALADMSGITVEKPVAEVTDKDIDEMLTMLQKQQQEWEKVERSAQNEDRVIIDFEGTMDGQPFAGGEAKDFELILGSGQLIDGFEQGLIGAAIGETKVLDLSFPENYGKQELAGKPVQFSVTIKEVYAPKLSALDDAFAKKFGVEEGGVAKLRTEIKSNMERELDFAKRNFVKEQVLNKLVECNALELPEGLLHEEQHRLQHEYQEQLKRMMRQKNVPTIPIENFLEQAKKRLSLSLLVREIIKKHQLSADQNKVKQRIEQLASAYEQPEQLIAWYQADKERLANIEAAVLEEQVVDTLLEQLKTKDKAFSYQELIHSARQMA